jgi:hypothetical protein
MHHCGTIKSALILLMHGANMKSVSVIFRLKGINTTTLNHLHKLKFRGLLRAQKTNDKQYCMFRCKILHFSLITLIHQRHTWM